MSGMLWMGGLPPVCVTGVKLVDWDLSRQAIAIRLGSDTWIPFSRELLADSGLTVPDDMERGVVYDVLPVAS